MEPPTVAGDGEARLGMGATGEGLRISLFYGSIAADPRGEATQKLVQLTSSQGNKVLNGHFFGPLLLPRSSDKVVVTTGTAFSGVAPPPPGRLAGV